MDQGKDGLSGKVAIVTGGSSGIGLASCCSLASEGASVVVVGRDQGRLDRAAVEIAGSSRAKKNNKNKVLTLKLDVRSERDMSEMAERAVQTFGRIDILVAGAGMLRPADSRPDYLFNLCESEFSEIIDTNLKGIFLSNRAVLKTMLSQRSGCIINISSLSGQKALPLDAAYCASKFAVRGLSEALAEEVSPYNVRVNCILPGNTDTPIWNQNRLLPKSPNTIPPERIADCILFLVKGENWVLGSDVGVSPAKLSNKDSEKQAIVLTNYYEERKW